MGKGYILINRRIEDHWLWTDKPFSRGQAWIDLLLMANYQDKTVTIKGKIIEVKRGQLLRSIDYLARRWGWSYKKVRSFVKVLEGQAQVTAEGTAEGTLITIENYALWQTLGQESGQAKGQAKGQAREHIQININKDKEINNYKGCRCPSLTEVKNYVEEQGYKMDVNAFYDYYEETGWTKKNGQAIKDWRATVRSWERRSREWAEKESEKHKPQRNPYKPQNYKSEPMPEYMRDKWKGGGRK